MPSFIFIALILELDIIAETAVKKRVIKILCRLQIAHNVASLLKIDREQVGMDVVHSTNDVGANPLYG